MDRYCFSCAARLYADEKLLMNLFQFMLICSLTILMNEYPYAFVYPHHLP